MSFEPNQVDDRALLKAAIHSPQLLNESLARLFDLFTVQRIFANEEQQRMQQQIKQLDRSIRDEQIKSERFKSELMAVESERDRLSRELQSINERYQAKSAQNKKLEQMHNDGLLKKADQMKVVQSDLWTSPHRSSPSIHATPISRTSLFSLSETSRSSTSTNNASDRFSLWKGTRPSSTLKTPMPMLGHSPHPSRSPHNTLLSPAPIPMKQQTQKKTLSDPLRRPLRPLTPVITRPTNRHSTPLDLPR